MIRWSLLLLGIASIVLGIVGYSMHPPIPEEARVLSVPAAVALLDEVDRVYVTIDTKLDVDDRVYSSLSARPMYSRQKNTETTEVELGSLFLPESLRSTLGGRVSVRARTEDTVIAINTLDDEEVVGQRILAPIEGADGQLWALSPKFDGKDRHSDAWMERAVHQGVLTRMKDIEVNASRWVLQYSFEDVREIAETELGMSIGGDTLLLLDEGSADSESELFSLPVPDSQGALLVTPFYEGQGLPSWTEQGKVTGVLWSWEVEDERRRDLELLLDAKLPARRGVLHHDETARELNEKTTFGLKLFVGLGVSLCLLAALGFLWRRLRKS